MADLSRQIVRAAGAGDVGAVSELLAQDAELANARGLGASTPLHMAAWKGKAAVVQLLLDAGADVNAHNENTHWAKASARCSLPRAPT